MASPAGQFHPWRLIISFLVITAGLYALVFFTPGSTAPKLGIDLQGGTRITLQAQTVDGSAPTSDSMQLARNIMAQRVNGSGVSGAQVQIDGADQLVITVPGTNNLTGLTRSARLNIRPMISRWPNPALITTTTPTGSTTVSGTTVTSPTATGTASASETTSPSETAATSVSQPTTSASADVAQGVRAPGQALAQPRAAGGDPSSDATAPPTSATASTSSTATPDSDTTAAPDGSDALGSAEAAPPLSVFPEGSNPAVPIQPAGDDAAAFKAWEQAAIADAQKGVGPTCTQIKYYQGLDDPDKPLLACDEEGTFVYLLDSTLIRGKHITDANSTLDTQGGHGWIINVTFDKTGHDIWADYTTKHWDRTDGANPPPASFTAFTLDGEVLSAPVINSPITSRSTMVSGNFTPTTAKALADSLKFGALPLDFDRLATKQVSAELGLQSLEAGLIAGGIGLALVILYCLVYYRLLGLITILSLFLSGGLIYAVMVLLGRWINLSLDMAGIAGLIIAIGITADSFVVYFERIKDEVREGRTFRSSVPRGWTRAKKTILSADAVSFLSAAVLYLLAVGDVKGFAFTLGLSTVLDLVVVFLVTHPLVVLLSKANIFAHPVWSGLGSTAQAGKEHRIATAKLQATEA